MAIGTPVARGTPWRGINTNNLSSNTWTPSADSLLLAFFTIQATATADSMAGQDGGTSWGQVLSTETYAGWSSSVWAAHTGSSPSSGSVTVSCSTSAIAACTFVEITGADVSGTLLNTFNDSDQGSAYLNTGTETFTLSLTGSTDLVVSFWYQKGAGGMTPENTSLVTNLFAYTQELQECSYITTGDNSPSVTTDTVPRQVHGFTFDIKEAGGAAATSLVLPRRSMTHMKVR